jgi:hypothetical protein
VVISRQLWVRRFAGDPEIVGRTIDIDSRQRSVIGVMDIGLYETDAWVPMTFDAADRENRVSHNLIVEGRLKPGVSTEKRSNRVKADRAPPRNGLSLYLPDSPADVSSAAVVPHNLVQCVSTWRRQPYLSAIGGKTAQAMQDACLTAS